jgi:hypothetical protein
MAPISPPERRELIQELYTLEDSARLLIRKIYAAIGPDCREELRYVNAKGDVFLSALDDLIHFDPSARSSVDAQLRELRRETDELIVKRAEIDRRLRDSQRHAAETAEDVQVARANRKAEEIQVEVSRIRGLGEAI